MLFRSVRCNGQPVAKLSDTPSKNMCDDEKYLAYLRQVFVPLVMHQDHGQSPDVCQGAINLGFSSVMMDGSLEADGKTIASYEYNVAVTRKVVDMAHATGVSVEGELGCLGSLETMQGDKEDGHGTDAVMTHAQ